MQVRSLAIAVAFATAAFAAQAAQAERVTFNFAGTFGADAYGHYKPGDVITGSVIYDRVFNSYDDSPFDGAVSVSYQTAFAGYESPVLYANYNAVSKVANFSGERSMPLFGVTFGAVPGEFGYLPTAAQIAGRVGWFNLSEVIGFIDRDETLFSGGTGTITVDGVAGVGVGAVPEPATWAMMLLGFGIVGAATRRKIRVSEVNFTKKIRALAEA